MNVTPNFLDKARGGAAAVVLGTTAALTIPAADAKADIVPPDILMDHDVVLRYVVGNEEGNTAMSVGDEFFVGFNINLDWTDTEPSAEQILSFDIMQNGMMVYGEEIATFEGGITVGYDNVPLFGYDTYRQEIDAQYVTEGWWFGVPNDFRTIANASDGDVIVLGPGEHLGLADLFTQEAFDEFFAGSSWGMDLPGGTVSGGAVETSVNLVPVPGAIALLGMAGLAAARRKRDVVPVSGGHNKQRL